MPDVYGPFDGSPWGQDSWYQFAPTWAPSGVVGAPQSSASAGPLGLTVSGLDISAALGRAWVYGAGYERTSTPWTYSVPANTNSNPRIDRLVLRRDLAAKTVLPVVIQGTPAASPVAPTIQQNETGTFDLTLFSWTTPGSSGAPLTNVIDERLWISSSTGDGGFVTRLVGKTTQTARSVNSSVGASTTKTADPDLQLSLGVGTYFVEAWMLAYGASTDASGAAYSPAVAWAATSGAVTFLGSGGIVSYANTPTLAQLAPGTPGYATGVGATGPVAARPSLAQFTAKMTTAGVLALMWAPATVGAGITAYTSVMDAGSWMRAVRVA